MINKRTADNFIEVLRRWLSSRFISPQLPDVARTARQIDMTLKILLGVTALTIPLVWQFDIGRNVGLASCVVAICGELFLLWQLRRGAVRLATFGLLAMLIVVLTLAGAVATQTLGLNAAYFLVLVVATASLILNFRQLIITILVCVCVLVGLGVFTTAQMQDPNDVMIMKIGLISVSVLLISISAIVAYNSRNLQDTLVQADMHQQALAVRNAELEREIAERQRAESLANLRSLELQRLLDASRVLSSTLELKPLLRAILTHLGSVVGFDEAMIAEFAGPNQYIVLASVPEHIDESPTPIIRAIDAERDVHLQALISQREPILINDIFADHPFAKAQHARWIRLYSELPAYVRSSLLMPLLARDQLIGYISIYSAVTEFYTPELANLGMAFAAQIASAIAVVRSHEKAVVAAGYSATMAERSRLARELHDSVSQALFGIVLGANTMLTSADSQRPVTRESMVYVLELAQAALSEMRALIFELRPETLHTEGLLNVLRKQAESLAARHHLAVNTHFAEEEPVMNMEAKEALYRIGLEAIQNVIKHAGAQHVDLWLEQEFGQVRLKIQDDGKGFNPADAFPGHFGLKTMAERAQLFGGNVQFISQVGQGACVLVEMPLASIASVAQTAP